MYACVIFLETKNIQIVKSCCVKGIHRADIFNEGISASQLRKIYCSNNANDKPDFSNRALCQRGYVLRLFGTKLK